MNGNQFIVTGNVGTDPELHKKNEGSPGVVAFSLAQNVSRLNEKTKKYEQVHTNWFQVRSFGNLAARVKASLKKGDLVTIIGRIRTYQYDDQNGVKRFGFEVLADDISLTAILKRDSGEGDFSPNFDEGVPF